MDIEWDRVGGTLIWYYTICSRQAWLMARQIIPDEDDENIVIGRLLHETRYKRNIKEIDVGASKIDLIKSQDGHLIVSEVKKSSRFKKSARLQVLFYLKELKARGIDAVGELLFPEERRSEKVELTDEAYAEVSALEQSIRELVNRPAPPPPKKISMCRQCAYAEYCWS